MKKRILAFLICALITMLSGCSGESYPKVVEDRDVFFSKIAGRYGKCYFNMYIFEDGTFQINRDETDVDKLNNGDGEYGYTISGSNPTILYQFSGSFKTIYQDSEFCFHTELSQLNKSLCIKTNQNKEPKFEYGVNASDDLNTLSYYGFYSNDIIYIYAPGMPVSELPNTTYLLEYNDMDSDGRLDDYLFLNYTKDNFVTRFDGGYYITDGVWVDYGINDSIIDVYDFDYYEVTVSRYDVSKGKLEQIASSIDGIKPLYYTTSGNRVIVFFDNGKANVISPTDDINKMKYFTEATDNKAKSPHMLYNYRKLPGYATLVKEAAAARAENT